MKIQITRTPPLDPELGVQTGQIYTTVGSKAQRRNDGCWILGKGGELVKVLSHEFEILDTADQEVPKGFYVVRCPDRVVVGLEIVRDNPFHNTRMQQLLNLALTEQAKLHAEWTDGDDLEKWGWETKLRVSMSGDISRQVNEDLEEYSERDLGLITASRQINKAMGTELRIPITVTRDVTRSFVEIVIRIIKDQTGDTPLEEAAQMQQD